MELKKTTLANTRKIKPLLFLFLLVAFICNAQIMQVKIVGGAPISSNEVITIEAGKSVPFKIINSEPFNCRSINIRKIELSGSSGSSSFSISLPETFGNILRVGCNDQIATYLDFTVTRDDLLCTEEEVTITIFYNVNEEFTFKLRIKKSPIISVLGGSPPADIIDGSPTTTANNGTYFGVVEVGAAVSRTFIITNTGSCNLDISTITSSNPAFPIYLQANSPIIAPGAYTYFVVVYSANSGSPTTSIITIPNTTSGSSNPYTFNVSATIFNVNIPGPGGVTANFRLWLKSTRGVVKSTTSKVSEWKDLGVNGESAAQTNANLQPSYYDNVAENINFNPVIKFENNGSSLNQYLENTNNGFYSQDIFIVMEPDIDVASSPGMSIFSGTVSNYTNIRGTFTGNANYDNDGDGIMNNSDVSDSNLANDLTSLGLGNLRSTERLWYNQGSATTNPNYNLKASSTKSYVKAGIINAHNKTETPSDGMSLSFNSIDDNIAPTNSIGSFANLGYIQSVPAPAFIWGTPYKIGKNAHSSQGSLNGRVAEIMTFAQRVPDADRPKIETYLAIKYGITLGAATEAKKNYVNSLGEIIWDITTDTQYNYNIAGIGRDDNSDLNQKQSKSINDTYEVTIGLGGIYSKNTENTNEFENNRDFLVWGCNNLEFTGASANTVKIATGITTSLTRIDRKWKIVESKVVVDGDVENVFVGIPLTAFSSFTKTTDEEYVLIVSNNEDLDDEYFEDEDIVDVIPLKLIGSNLQTWYDFDGTKYFTFGKAPKLTRKSAVNIAAGDYLVGEYALNLNINAFTISAWIRSVPSSAGTDPRTIMAKGSKLQLRLNSDNKIEVVLEDVIVFTSTPEVALDDSKWHQITFVYASGRIFLYIDGILDKSVQGVNPPTPNYNHFSLGALYVSKGSGISNPFLGEIDEVYVWDQGLTQDQIRYLMNQEIERFDVGDTDYANGKVMPQAAASNEVTTIPWSKLRAYYDFNSFYGSTVEGLTNDRNFLRINYLNKTKTIVEAQTAPLPYTTIRDGSWSNNIKDETPWTYGSTVWNIPNSLALDGETTIDWNIVETKHNIASDRNITVLGLKNNSGIITIKGANAVEAIPGTGQSLRITHYLELDGVIDLEGESQLLQDQGSVLDQDSGGYIEKDQQGTANSFNYNYWSSSVGPVLVDTNTKNSRGIGTASINAPFTIKGIINDGRSASPTPPPPPPGILSILYGTSPYAANATPGAQLTISSYWLYQFYGKDDDYNSWFPRINENSPLAPGVGYTMKGSSGKVPITNQQNYVFRGKPYNGDISLELKNSDGIQRDRLIGNPYPSALDANEFILDNIKDSGGRNTEGNIFNGALYFWDHFGEVNSHNLGAYVGGYATYTLIGGVNAQSTDLRINHDNSWGDKIPERYIPVGQGFFVITAIDYKIDGVTPVNGTLPVVKGGTITFKNSHRYFKREGSSGLANTGSVFMKNSNSKSVQPEGGKEIAETNEEIDLRPKIRLLFHSPSGYNRQLLIGADENTTNNFNIGYDGLIADTGSEDMFWMIQGAKFVIQGVPDFDTDQEFPLGIKIAKAGLATIKIDELENMDEDISAHIKDKLTGETHNISQKAFEINLEAKTYLDRFALIFKMQKLVAEDVVAEVLIPAVPQPIIEGIHVYMNNAIGELQIKNNSTEEILSVALINTLGQTIKTWNSNFNIRTISLPLSTATGIYLVQINTKTGNMVKKISVE